MTRWKAAAIHLLLSAVIIGTLAATMVATWYGWELFQVSGGKRLLGILAACDIVIGPLLTLIVYKAGKKSLKFDLTVIALLQACFFFYGLNVMRESRPIFLVAVLDRFELVFNNELADEDLAKATKPEFRARSLTGPRMIGGIVARNSKEALDLALSGFAGRDVQLLPERYTDYAEVAAQIATRAKPVTELIGNSGAEAARKLERAVAASGHAEKDVFFVPINSRRGLATMLLLANTGEVLGPVAVDPWPATPKE
jgi:hypothetical protein